MVSFYVYRKLSFDLPKGDTSMTYGSFRHFKRSFFRTDISNRHNWDFLSSSKDPNELWSESTSNFLATAEKTPQFVLSVCVPTRHLGQKLMHSRDIVKIKAINSNDTHDWACFKRMRNKVSVVIRQAKELFYRNKFSEFDGDLRKTWQVINYFSQNGQVLGKGSS